MGTLLNKADKTSRASGDRILTLKAVLLCLGIFACFLAYYVFAALDFPLLFNIDDFANYEASKFIYTHHHIPVVDPQNAGLYFSEIGTTRSLRPPFTFIVSAMVATALDGTGMDLMVLLRLGAPLIAALVLVVAFIGFMIAFRNIALALAGTLCIGLLPRFVFLASCNNDDIGAILSASLLFVLLIALTKRPDSKGLLITFAFSVGFVLQTKFTAWLSMPWVALYCAVILAGSWRTVLKVVPLMIVVFLLGGSWWVIFNMAHYGLADPTAMKFATHLQAMLSEAEPNRQGYASHGIGVMQLLGNHDQFLVRSFKSLIGYLEWINLEVGRPTYAFYGGLFFAGIVAAIVKIKSKLVAGEYIELLFLLIIVSQCVFYLQHNLLRDIQPQARYILPVILPLVYLVLRAIHELPKDLIWLSVAGRQFGIQAVSACSIIVICVLLHLQTLSAYILPAYKHLPYYTSLKKPVEVNLSDRMAIRSSSSISYSMAAGMLQLRPQRQQPGDVATIVFDTGFCDLLPQNALLTLTLTADRPGGMYIMLDRDNEGSYRDKYWRSFSSGLNNVVFSIRSPGCTGAKLTLSKVTGDLQIQRMTVNELRIHQHGNPL